MADIKPVDTIYGRYRFRSRLEARWACFFDALGIKYEYEKEGYDVGGTWYLPDFWLPDYEYWVEIKAQSPTPEEKEKIAKVAELTRAQKAFIFYGNIPAPETDEWPLRYGEHVYPGWDDGQCWCDCQICGEIGIEFDGRAERLCKCTDAARLKNFRYDSPLMIQAFAIARHARFEHGETPR